MSKKAVTVTISLVLIVSMLLSMGVINLARANFALIAPSIEIRSPRDYYTKVYQNTTIDVEIAVSVLKDAPAIQKIVYSLDGDTNLKVPDITKDNQLVSFGPDRTGYIYYGRAVLENLPEGNHTLVAHYMDVTSRVMSARVDFRIDLDYEPPRVLLLSPQNQTYSSSHIPLIFTVNGKEIRNAYYILDLNGREPI